MMFKETDRTKWQGRVNQLKQNAGVILNESVLNAKRSTKRLLNPPKRIVTNPKFHRILIIFLILFIFYLGVASFAAKNAYSFRDKYSLSFMEKIFPYPVATVGKKAILLQRLKNDMSIVNYFIKVSKTKDRYQGIDIKKILYERLIENYLISNIARNYKIKLTQEEMNKAWNDLLVEQEGVNDLHQILRDYHNINESQLKAFIRETLLKEKVSELPKRRKVYHILLTYDKNNQEARQKVFDKLNELKSKIESGGSFADLAKENSQDVKSRDLGGELGWFDVGFQLESKNEPDFKQAIFDTTIGKISDPVETNIGLHLVHPTEEKGIVDRSLAQLIAEAKSKVKIIRFIKFD